MFCARFIVHGNSAFRSSASSHYLIIDTDQLVYQQTFPPCTSGCDMSALALSSRALAVVSLLRGPRAQNPNSFPVHHPPSVHAEPSRASPEPLASHGPLHKHPPLGHPQHALTS